MKGSGAVHMDNISVHHLTVMLSSICTPLSVDFIITSWGVQMLTDDNDLGIVYAPILLPPLVTVATVVPAVMDVLTVGMVHPPLADIFPLDIGSMAGDFQPPQPGDC